MPTHLHLRSKLIHLAHQRPDLRRHLLPLITSSTLIHIPGYEGGQFPTTRLDTWLYHGGGRGGMGFGNDLGKGVYWAYEPDYAAHFGDTLWKARVRLAPVLQLHDMTLDEIAEELVGEPWHSARGDRTLIRALQATGVAGIDHDSDDPMEREVVDWTGKTNRLLIDQNIVSTTGLDGLPWDVIEAGNRQFRD